MKRTVYETPTMQVVELQGQCQILETSGGITRGDNYGWITVPVE